MMQPQSPPKTRRTGCTYCIQHKTETDIRVLFGNRIVSRHTTPGEARDALNALLRKPKKAEV